MDEIKGGKEGRRLIFRIDTLNWQDMVYRKLGTKFAFSRADVWKEYLYNCFKWLNVTWLSLLSILYTSGQFNSSILSGGFQGQPMESGFLTSLLVAFSCLLITLAGLLVTDANWNRCPVLYLHHPRIVKCYAIFCGYEYLLRLEWHFIDCLDHELRKWTVTIWRTCKRQNKTWSECMWCTV